METLIVAGGEINKDNIKHYANKFTKENIIAVDKGLEVLNQIKIIPNYVVGDFDSINMEVLEYYKKNKQIIFNKYNSEKDYTDTEIALKLAIKLNSSNIIIMGAMGKRMDHAIANIHILKLALEAKIPCQIIDEHNKIYLVEKNKTLKKEEIYGKYISCIPLTTTVEGLTLKGVKYPLNKACLPIGKSLGVSNEIVQETATIEMEKRNFNCNRKQRLILKSNPNVKFLSNI